LGYQPLFAPRLSDAYGVLKPGLLQVEEHVKVGGGFGSWQAGKGSVGSVGSTEHGASEYGSQPMLELKAPPDTTPVRSIHIIAAEGVPLVHD
tara:strand:- start:90 stop:365 length:276 start_codon:yes stop_codon:yes gene_type:complete